MLAGIRCPTNGAVTALSANSFRNVVLRAAVFALFHPSLTRNCYSRIQSADAFNTSGGYHRTNTAKQLHCSWRPPPPPAAT
jgi:hypothetical protein